MTPWIVLIVIGLIAGLCSGLFGIGGGIIVVPLLVSWAGFSQHRAVGTSLLLLLPPLGLAAAVEFYRHGYADIRAGAIIAVTIFFAAWLGARIATALHEPYLRLVFAVFVVCIGIYLVFAACRRLGWTGTGAGGETAPPRPVADSPVNDRE
jgi:uncharacterized protein